MLVATVLGVVCLSLPLGYFCTSDGVRYANLYNLWLQLPSSGGHIFSPWALFALLLLTSSLTFFNIFLYRRRALQMRVMSLCIILLVGYYAYFAFFAYVTRGGGTFTPSITAAFPFACIVLDYLSFRGILKDEMLVRSLDRLR